MAHPTPTGPPSTLHAGDSVRFRIADHPDYPNSEGWDLQYNLQGVDRLLDDADITVVFQTSGDDENHWLVTITAAKTANLSAGRYRLMGHFAGSGSFANRRERLDELDTVLVVLPDPATTVANAFQTHAERTLAVIEAVLEGRLTDDIEQYQIAGRSVSKIPIEQLTKLRGRYAAMVQQERTGRLTRRHLVRFPVHA